MERPTIRLAVLAVALSVPAAAQPPTTGPEQRLVRYWVGDWTYDLAAPGAGQTGAGSLTAKAFAGGLFVRYDEVYRPASGSPVEILGIMGYDAREKAYFWHRYWSNGFVDAARGWLNGSTWTFDFGESRDDGKVVRVQMVMTEEAADRLAFRWQRSIDGQPWEVTSEGRGRKAK